MNNKQEDFEALISIWETLSELWQVTATRHKEDGNLELAAICQARQYTFWRCARDLRGFTDIHGELQQPPPTIPGMDFEEYHAIVKTLKTKKTWWQKIKQTFNSQQDSFRIRK